MAKDYFQDIIPPSSDDGEEIKINRSRPEPSHDSDMDTEAPPAPIPERTIRNIPAPARRPSRPISAFDAAPPERSSRRGRRWIIWVAAIIAIIVVAVLVVLFFFSATTITLTPKSDPLTFDQTAQFTAYPAATAATGTLTYTVQTLQLNASETVAAQGTQEVQTKASGTITVFNAYSTSPQMLIKNTRFETPSGLIFRAPAQVVIPGKTASGPGSVNITVVADQPGAQYNVAPIARFSVPGLQSDAAMYANIYAASNASTTGGFEGEEPAADPAAVSGAVSDLRTQLQSQAAQAVQSMGSSTVAFPGLIQIAYQDEPNSASATSSSSVEVNETANVQIPVFPADLFAQTIAQSVAADASTGSFTILPGTGYGATLLSATSTNLGSDPINFSLAGQAMLVWNIDTQSLKNALAGHDQGAFQTIVAGFPSIEEAHARIEPFWQSTFPSDPSKIHVVIEQPASSF